MHAYREHRYIYTVTSLETFYTSFKLVFVVKICLRTEEDMHHTRTEPLRKASGGQMTTHT